MRFSRDANAWNASNASNAWSEGLNGDPTDWLLEPDDPAVRHLALRDLLDRPPDDLDILWARTAAMASDPIASILAAQNPEGWWVKAGVGYNPKYTGTTWSLMFLGQLGADGTDPRVRAACEYVLDHTQSAGGGFGYASSGTRRPAPSSAIHCLNGNLLAALIGFGWLDDERVQRSLAWQAASITGESEGEVARYALTPGPGFRCGFNRGRPCAWGATKAVLGLAGVPEAARTPAVAHALTAGVELLLSCDPATADYPSATPGAKLSGSWFKLGFPCGYVTDVLQVLEALCAAGAAGDPRLGSAVEWLTTQQDGRGRWANRHAYEGKLIRDIDRPGQPSKWVTLRACRVLKAVAAAQ
jgi:hypothetical protein